MSVTAWLKHAFAVEPAGPMALTDEQRSLIDGVCRRIVERDLAAPAILFLESSQPLGPIAAQSLVVLQPWFELVVQRHQLQEFVKFLDHRGSVEFLCRRIEELENERTAGV